VFSPKIFSGETAHDLKGGTTAPQKEKGLGEGRYAIALKKKKDLKLGVGEKNCPEKGLL